MAQFPFAEWREAVMFRIVDWQQIVALAIVAVTAALLVWSRVRRRRFKFGRDTHCGCSAPGATAPKSSIIFHGRKGETPRVIVKMN